MPEIEFIFIETGYEDAPVWHIAEVHRGRYGSGAKFTGATLCGEKIDRAHVFKRERVSCAKCTSARLNSMNRPLPGDKAYKITNEDNAEQIGMVL